MDVVICPPFTAIYAVAQAVRIIYGGSVAPTHAEALLVSPEADGPAHQGRRAETFVQIVRHIAAAKAGR